jgi:trehalose 6-phosphate phosphatase
VTAASAHKNRFIALSLGSAPDPYAHPVHEDRLRPFIEAPESAAFFMDFDGTLSEIVPDPASARPVDGAREAVAALARRLGLVAVVSGRSAKQLLEWLGPEIEIWGVHGAERVEGGRVVTSDHLMPYLNRMEVARKEAERLLADHDGLLVEDKGPAVALHYRQAPETDLARDVVERTASDLAARYELVIGRGRMVVELKAPVAFSKADVVGRRAREVGVRAVAFAGDDLVDVPAFEELDQLESEGLTCLRVAVASDEAPEELLAHADVIVDGPLGVVEFLSKLAV